MQVSSMDEITCADFDDLLADFNELHNSISPQHDSDNVDGADSSITASMSLLAAPCQIYYCHNTNSTDAAPYQDIDDIICALEHGHELPLFSWASTTSQPLHSHDSSLHPAAVSSNLSTPTHFLVVRHVLSTQLVTAEQGQRHNLFQSRYKLKGQVCRFIIDGGS